MDQNGAGLEKADWELEKRRINLVQMHSKRQ